MSSKPTIDIALAGQRKNHINSYSTADTIEGLVSLSAQQDTTFDAIEIAFTGTTRTSLDRVHAGAPELSHTFLNLRQPIDEDVYPSPRLLESGRTYTFPFLFVVPDRLLAHSCNHFVANHKVRDCHLQLPPSLGDREVSQVNAKLVDDFAPEMLTIQYAIGVKIARTHERDGHSLVLAEKQRNVRVVPATDEQPPVDVGAFDEYCLRTEKKIKRSLLKGKVGSLAMEAAQPSHIQLRGHEDATPPTTMAVVNLRFDPSDGRCELPRLGALNTRLKIHTYFASTPFINIPNRSQLDFDTRRAVRPDVVTLSLRDMQAAQWQEHAPHTDASDVIFRRISKTSETTTPCPEPTSTYACQRPFYTTQLCIPITLPDSKIFVPSFQCCLAARTYILDLSLNVGVPGGTPGAGSTLHLKVPLQISSKGSLSASPVPSRESITASEAALIDDYFTPRSFAVPSESTYAIPSEDIQASAELPAPPPEYSYFPQGVSSQQRRVGVRRASIPFSWALAAAAVMAVR